MLVVVVVVVVIVVVLLLLLLVFVLALVLAATATVVVVCCFYVANAYMCLSFRQYWRKQCKHLMERRCCESRRIIITWHDSTPL